MTGDDDRGLNLTDHIEDRSAASLKHPPAAGDVMVREERAAGRVARPEGSHRFPGWAWAVTVGVAGIAFGTRLVPVLRGGGLYGLGNYDDGVYYSAATALVHGQLPYRDFLLLQPPGIAVLLAPFALVGQLTSDADGFAAARLAWMLLGVASAVLVCLILRPLGLIAAAAGGLFYAVFYPAVYAEHTTLLEAPGNTALLVAIWLLNRARGSGPGPRHAQRLLVVAGALLGLSAGLKIWGVVVILLVVGWEAIAQGVRRAGWLVGGVAAGGVAVYVPFFAATPTEMWNEVVRDQLYRSLSATSTATRLANITGLGLHHPTHPTTVLLVAAVAAFVLAMGLAWLMPEARLAVVLLAGLSVLLLLTPTWFPHYAGLVAPPAAVVAGAAVAAILGRIRAKASPWQGRALVALTVAAGAACLLVYLPPLVHLRLNRPFPAGAFTSAVSAAPGCVAADNSTALILTNALSRNLQRGCRTVVDLSGYSHDVRAATGTKGSRVGNRAWQRFVLAYFRSGSAAFVITFDDGTHFNANTVATLDQWPVLAKHGQYVLRTPQR